MEFCLYIWFRLEFPFHLWIIFLTKQVDNKTEDKEILINEKINGVKWYVLQWFHCKPLRWPIVRFYDASKKRTVIALAVLYFIIFCHRALLWFDNFK